MLLDVLSDANREQPEPEQAELLAPDVTTVSPGNEAVLSVDEVKDSGIDVVAVAGTKDVELKDADAEVEHS